ncbi:MAG: hypothetical protein HYV28_13870 [Ignavibacteriales bacterium]|nr:hypothetical protein [Ignavibacteriales bacterium]
MLRAPKKNPDVMRVKEGIKLPSAEEIEMAVLGAMMIDKETVYKGMHILNEDIFFSGKHRNIFIALRNLFKLNEGIDHFTVFSELKRLGKEEEAGGASYLIELTQNIDSPANFEHYARIILEKSILRELISVSHEIASEAYNAKQDALSIMSAAERKIFEITEKHIKKNYVDLKTAVNEAMDYLDSIHSKDFLSHVAVPTGYYDLDALLGGFQKSDLPDTSCPPIDG